MIRIYQDLILNKLLGTCVCVRRRVSTPFLPPRCLVGFSEEVGISARNDMFQTETHPLGNHDGPRHRLVKKILGIIVRLDNQ